MAGAVLYVFPGITSVLLEGVVQECQVPIGFLRAWQLCMKALPRVIYESNLAMKVGRANASGNSGYLEDTAENCSKSEIVNECRQCKRG